MRPMLRVTAAGFAAVLALSACGGDDDDDGAASDATTTVAPDDTENGGAGDATTTTLAAEDPSDDVAPALAVGETALGPTLVNAEGLTLYVFDNDTDTTSACVDACATAWPPLTVEGEPTIGDDLDADDLGTIARADGTTQVTFDGMPLYTFSADENPGDTNGLGVGEVWWPLSPDGEKLTGAENASTGGGGVGDY